MRKFGSQGGFTLIELVMVIVILGILAIVAIPRFIDLRDEARAASEQGVVGAVRGGIAIYRADALASGTTPEYPTELDDSPTGTAEAVGPFFDNVIDYGITEQWVKTAAQVYEGPTGTTYTYNPTTGAFD